MLVAKFVSRSRLFFSIFFFFESHFSLGVQYLEQLLRIFFPRTN